MSVKLWRNYAVYSTSYLTFLQNTRFSAGRVFYILFELVLILLDVVANDETYKSTHTMSREFRNLKVHIKHMDNVHE